VNLKKLCVMALCAFLLSLAFSGVGKSAPEEPQSVYCLEYGGLTVDIRAPDQAYPGENITVTVKTETAVPEIYVKSIKVELYGVIDATTRVSLENITHLRNSFLSSPHEVQYNVTIPDDISPGLTYGIINCEWDLWGSPQKIPSSGFVLTYIKDIKLEELQAEYDELNASHQSIVEDYAELKSGTKEVDSTRNLMYIFIATTVVSSITVVVLLMKKPKKVWV